MQSLASGRVAGCVRAASHVSSRASAAAPSHPIARNAIAESPNRIARALRSSSRRSVIALAKPQKVTAEELEVALADRETPIIVDFYATWCGPCVLLAKELETVAQELGDKVKILKIDTDENPQISSQLQIQGLPTMVFIGMDPAKPALRTEGLLPAATIKQILANEL